MLIVLSVLTFCRRSCFAPLSLLCPISLKRNAHANRVTRLLLTPSALLLRRRRTADLRSEKQDESRGRYPCLRRRYRGAEFLGKPRSSSPSSAPPGRSASASYVTSPWPMLRVFSDSLFRASVQPARWHARGAELEVMTNVVAPE